MGQAGAGPILLCKNTYLRMAALNWQILFHTKITFVTALKIEFCIKDFFSKCNQIRRKLEYYKTLFSISTSFLFLFINSRENDQPALLVVGLSHDLY